MKGSVGTKFPDRGGKMEMIVLETEVTRIERKRTPGLYWVRRLGESTLRVARLRDNSWFITGSQIPLTDDSFAAISEQPIMPPNSIDG
jgi:hypothetical protein